MAKADLFVLQPPVFAFIRMCICGCMSVWVCVCVEFAASYVQLKNIIYAYAHFHGFFKGTNILCEVFGATAHTINVERRSSWLGQ